MSTSANRSSVLPATASVCDRRHRDQLGGARTRLASVEAPPRADGRAASGIRFGILVGEDLRTTGVALIRRDRSAVDLAGLDLDELACAAASTVAAAHGKVVVISSDDVQVLQTKPGLPPARVWCANAAACVAYLLGVRSHEFVLFGPAGRSAAVVQQHDGSTVRQLWTLLRQDIREVAWRGHTALVTDFLNSYAVVLGGLPDDVTPEQARRELAGSGLGAKLAVVSAAGGCPTVAFHNAHGRHGAAPATGLATLAVLARFGPAAAGLLAAGHVTIVTRAGPATVELPCVADGPAGTMTVALPPVAVRRLDDAGDPR